MHIYSDESGGTDAACAEFLVSAVHMAPGIAAKLMRQFRKKARPRVSDEIKGHQLTPEQRSLFFRLLSEQVSSVTVVVAGRSQPIGGWAMRNLTEADLWIEMLIEAARTFASIGAEGMTVDRGRHNREQLRRVLDLAEQRLRPEFGAHFRIHAAGSESAAGLQVADIVANTAYHRNSVAPNATLARALIAASGIRVLSAVPSQTPRWLMVN